MKIGKIGLVAIAVIAAVVAKGDGFLFRDLYGKIRIVGAKYGDSALAARQMELKNDGIMFHFDADKLPSNTTYSTMFFPSEGEIKRDLYGKRYKLHCRKPMVCRATNNMAINLNDRDGETFQFLPIEIENDEIIGDLICTYEFTPGNHGRPWHNSPKADGKFDGPAVLNTMNVHFNGRLPNSGSVEFISFQCEEHAKADNLERNIVTDEPIAIRGVWPGPTPFHGAEWLEFSISKDFKGKARLVLTEAAHHFVYQANKREFEAVANGDGKIRFNCKLPYKEYFHFYKLNGPKEVFSGRGEFHQTAAEAMRVEVETGNPLHIVRDEKQGEKAELVIRNAAQRESKIEADFTFTDVFGTKVEMPRLTRQFAKGETVRVAIPQLPKKGVWFVLGKIKADDGSTNDISTRFARIDLHEVTPFLEKPKFRFGIHFHCARYLPDQFDVLVDALVASGAKFTRSDYDFTFGALSKKEGEYDFSISDPLIRKMRSAGLALEIICFSMPAWARDEEALKAAKITSRLGTLRTKPGATYEFCRAMAARYGTEIDYYEIGNEWDLSPKANFPIKDMLAVQREAYEGLHAGNPKVCVIPNGWAYVTSKRMSESPQTNKGAIEAFAQHPELYDAWSLHCHGAFLGFVSALQEDFLPLYESTPLKTRPWICGETACSCQHEGELMVAKTVWAKILYGWSWGSHDHIWYNLKATGWFSGGESGYGLLTADLKPRAGYAAFAAATTIFQGLDADGRIYSKDLRHILRFKGEKAGFKGVVLAGWEWYREKPLNVRIRTDAKRAEISDHMGNRTPVEIRDGEVIFGIRDAPRALILHGASFAEASDPKELRD